MKQKPKKIKVVELFAGVGGFRLGLENAASEYEIVWSNQWEPATKKQHASEIYTLRFGQEGHSNVDISKVQTSEIPNHDLLVGGFPCQDYSVARTLSQAAGLNGKKGVLWWEIHRIIKEKGPDAPSFLMLENVDRLLKSPSAQRGRDFAIMLSSLSDLGYIVEWRVINAADYGMPQRRRRVYILAYKKNTYIHSLATTSNPEIWITKEGIHASAFPVHTPSIISTFQITGSLFEITNNFNKGFSSSPFNSAGIIIGRDVWTFKALPKWSQKGITLNDIIEKDVKKIPVEYFINKKDLHKWKKLKGAKSEERESKNGFTYKYSEGPMVFPDSLDKPSRTIVTGEGGSAPSRFKHVIETKDGRLRRLTPEELEKLNMFPVGHTKEASSIKRAFFMGNALVVGIVEKLSKTLKSKIINDNKKQSQTRVKHKTFR